MRLKVLAALHAINAMIPIYIKLLPVPLSLSPLTLLTVCDVNIEFCEVNLLFCPFQDRRLHYVRKERAPR